MAASTVEMTIDRIRSLGTFRPIERAYSGLVPAAVIAVPSRVRRKAAMAAHAPSQATRSPVGM